MPALESFVDALLKDSDLGSISRNAETFNSSLAASDDGSLSLRDTSCAICNLPPLVVRSLAILMILSVLSFSMIAIRVYTRYQRCKKLSLDDVLVVLAWMTGVVGGAMNHLKDSFGFGDAQPTILELSQIYYQQFIFMQFFYITLGMIQLSVAINYRRLDGGLSITYRRVCDALIAYTLIGTLLETMTYVFQCLPVKAFWTLTNRGTAKCFSTHLSNILIIYFPPLFRISVDCMLIAIPIPIIWKLSLPRSQKAAIIAIICISFTSIGANLRRLLLTEPDSSTPITEFLSNILPRIQVWSNIEIHTALFCACAVTLKAPFINIIRTLRLWLRPKSRKASINSNTTTISEFLTVSERGSIKKQELWHDRQNSI